MADNVLFYDPLLVNTETNKVSLEKESNICYPYCYCNSCYFSIHLLLSPQIFVSHWSRNVSECLICNNNEAVEISLM